jgi:exoribonuclease-2
MNVFFEDDGQLKAGTVLADNDSSLQVESTTGKRIQVKAAAVLLRFAAPAATALHADAHALAATLDVDFLWEVSGDDEFGFAELATEYFGHPPTAVESAAVALAGRRCISTSGAGRYRKAPAELKAALMERKKRSRAERAGRRSSPRRLPDVAGEAPMLLYKPDRNTLEWKALPPPATRSRAFGGAARRLRRDSVDARLPLQRLPGAGVPKGLPFRPGAACRRRPSCRSPRCRRFRSTTPPPPRSTMPSR